MGDHTYRWCDVVAFARASGEWEALAATAARQARAVAAEPDGVGVGVDRAVQEAAVAFRRAQRLLAADELASWLEQWAMTSAEWLACLRGQLIAGSLGAGPMPSSDTAADHPTWIAAVCSGALRAQARRLALGLAARVALGGQPLPPTAIGDPAAVLALGTDIDRYLGSHCGDEQLEIEVHNHRLDWTLVHCAVVVHQREAVLREVAMCVRNDGLSLAAAGARAGLTPSPVWTRVVEVDPALRGLLAAAGAGDVIGPVASGGSLLIAQIVDRAEPSPSEPDTRAYARAHTAQRASAIAVTEHVSWHDGP